MSSDRFLLTLVQSKDDAPPFSSQYQAELRQFAKQAHATSQRAFTMDSVLGGGGPIGEFIFDATAVTALINALKTICVEWINAHNGRTLKLKYGDVEVEAPTAGEINALVKLAEKHGSKGKKTNLAQ